MRPYAPMTPAEINTLGGALFGPRWKSALAREIGLTYRQILRYSIGEAPIPKVVAVAIRLLSR